MASKKMKNKKVPAAPPPPPTKRKSQLLSLQTLSQPRLELSSKDGAKKGVFSIPPPPASPPPVIKNYNKTGYKGLLDSDDSDDEDLNFDLGNDEDDIQPPPPPPGTYPQRPISAELISGKRALKKPSRQKAKKLIPVSVPRTELYFNLEKFEDKRFYPINSAWRAIADQMLSGDITNMDFRGIDQLTDALFYYLIENKVDLTYLSKIFFDGCVHITDLTILWLLKLCGGRNLKEISLKGCRGVTSVSLKNLVDKCPNLETVHADGTSVSNIPKALVSSRVIVKLNGCPLVHSRNAEADFASSSGDRSSMVLSNVPHYKALLWGEEDLQISVSALLTKNETSRAIPGMRHFSSDNFLPDHFSEKIGMNIYEVIGIPQSNLVDTMVSDGCLVMLPYTFSSDAGEQRNQINQVIKKITSVLSKTKFVYFLLIEVASGLEKDLPPSPKTLPDITKALNCIKASLKADIDDILKKGTYASGLDFKGQRQTANLFHSYEMYEIIVARINVCRLNRAGTEVAQSADHLMGMVKEACNKLDHSVKTTYKSVDQDFHKHLIKPALALSKNAAFPEVAKAMPSYTRENYFYSSLLKAFEIMDIKGICIFDGSREPQMCFTDFTKMTKLFQLVADAKQRTVQLGAGIRVPFISESVPCWSRDELENAMSGVVAKDDVDAMTEYLAEQGHVLPLRCDRYEAGQESMCYVPYAGLPRQPPPEVLASLWNDAITDKLVQQRDRFFHFKHGMPSSFMALVLQKASKFAQFKLLWSTGAVIQHGFVDCLLQTRDGDVTGQVILGVSVQVHKKSIIARPEPTVRDCMWQALYLYSTVIESTMEELRVYAKITHPCINCKPKGKLLERMSEAAHAQFSVPLIKGVKRAGQKIKCSGACGTEMPVDSYGPDGAESVVPVHDVRRVQRVIQKDLLERYSKCFLCNNCADRGMRCPRNGLNGKSQRDCACETKLSVCPGCGICERCKQSLHDMEGKLYPVLSSYGSMTYLETEQKHDVTYSPGTRIEPSPNTGNIVHVKIGNVLTLQPRGVALSPGALDRMEIVLTQPNSAQVDLSFFKGKQRSESSAFMVYKSRTGEILGESDGANRKSSNWSTNKGDTIQVRIRIHTDKIGNLKTSLTLLLNGEVIRTETGLPWKIYFRLDVYQDNGGTKWGIAEPAEFLILAPSFRYCKEEALHTDIRSLQDDICNTQNGQIMGFSACEVSNFQSIELVKNSAMRKRETIPGVILPQKVTEDMVKYTHWSNLTAASHKLHPICLSVDDNLASRIAHMVSTEKTLLVEQSYYSIHFQSKPGLQFENYNPASLPALLILLLFRLVYEPKLPLVEAKSLIDWLPGQTGSETPDAEISHWVHKALTQMMFQLHLPAPDAEDDETGLATYRQMTAGFSDVSQVCDAHRNCSSGAEVAPLMESLKTDDAQYITFLAIEMTDEERAAKTDFVLPDNFFGHLQNLLRLQIVNTPLRVLPKGIGQCKHLTELMLERNDMNRLPEDLGDCAASLQWLSISSNIMNDHKLPVQILECTNLRALYADYIFLTSLPGDIGNLKKLETLSLKGNCLRNLPPSIKQLQRLRYLDLSGVEWFWKSARRTGEIIPKEAFCAFLKKQNWPMWWYGKNQSYEALMNETFDTYDLAGNGLLDDSEILECNARLYYQFPRFESNGYVLMNGENSIELPPELFSLRNLETLILAFQGIYRLSPAIDKLVNLKHLNLSACPFLEELPGEIGDMELKSLTILDCPSLRTPPREIQRRSLNTILSYLKHLEIGGTACKRTKLMLVGLGGAGKTSLVNALLSGTGKANLGPGEKITDGIDIHEWKVADKKSTVPITYSVWDFAGQTVYYNTHQFFLSNRAVYLLLWNIRLGHEHAGLDFWLSSISVHAPKAPIFVVGTHLDQVSKSDLPVEEMKEKYPQIIGFHFVSTHNGQGVSDLQEDLIKTTLAQRYMGESIPKIWLKLESSLLERRSETPIVPYTDVEEIAADNGIVSDSQKRAIQFLHELGSIIHFDNEFLRDRVVVDPQWIVDVMACVVSVKDSPIKEGRFLHKHMSTVWKDYDTSLHPWLLRLTEEYDLTFPLTDKDVNLVPCLLPEKQPKFDWPVLDKNSSLTETKMIYKFVYLPAGLFNRGQVRLYQYSDSSIIWKKGSLLRKKGHIALVSQTSDTEMLVKVQGPRPENFIFMVHEVFEGLISESFNGVHYEYSGPCPDCIKTRVNDPFMFSSTTLRRAKVMKASFLQCSTYFHNITISALNTNMPPDSSFDYDQQLMSTVQSLTSMKREMGADIFLSYCEKDLPGKGGKDIVDTRKVRDDLEAAGFNCYYPPRPSDSDSLEKMAIVARDSKVFVSFVSDAYADDPTCCSLFKFVRYSLQKPWVMVVIGKGQEWKKSSLGVFISDELFVNMVSKDRYADKLAELKEKLQQKSDGTEKADKTHSPCFLSYCWSNSLQAIQKGSKKKEGALGWGDPREFKDHLESNGVKCWIDVENIGKRGLFEDIARGLRHAKVVVACISDEYAASTNCMMEFRFATGNLGIPTLLAIVGTGNHWKRTEIGMLAQKNLLPEIHFQEEDASAKEKMLKVVSAHIAAANMLEGNKERKVEKRDKKKVKKTEKDEENMEKRNTSYSELFELAQRNFLRQVAGFAEQSGETYPRLLVLDFMDMYDEDTIEETKADDTTHEKEAHIPADPLMSHSRPTTAQFRSRGPQGRPMTSQGRPTMGKHGAHRSVGPKSFYTRDVGVNILCEHEEGWHSHSHALPVKKDFLEERLERYAPYLARITAILRHSNNIYLKCASGIEGAQYIKWLEDQPELTSSDFSDVYKEFRKEVIELDKDKTMGGLKRCHLPNGKTVWLCPEHQKLPRVTVLAEDTDTLIQNVGSEHDEALLELISSPTPTLCDKINGDHTKYYGGAWPGMVKYKPLPDAKADDDDDMLADVDIRNDLGPLSWSSDEDEPGTSGARQPEEPPKAETLFSMPFESLNNTTEEITVTDPTILGGSGAKGIKMKFQNVKGETEEVPVVLEELEEISKQVLRREHLVTESIIFPDRDYNLSAASLDIDPLEQQRASKKKKKGTPAKKKETPVKKPAKVNADAAGQSKSTESKTCVIF